MCTARRRCANIRVSGQSCAMRDSHRRSSCGTRRGSAMALRRQANRNRDQKYYKKEEPAHVVHLPQSCKPLRLPTPALVDIDARSPAGVSAPTF
jgi:hypothetical protein